MILIDEAKDEIRSFGGKAKARIGEKINHVQRLGWEEALKLKLVKDLGDIVDGIFEIIVKGTGEAYRLLCFQSSDPDGRLVVVTLCEAKSGLLGGKLKRQVRRAAGRRDAWLKQQEEERK